MDGIAELLFNRLVRITAEKLHIFIRRLGDDVERQLLGTARLAVDVETQTFGRGIGQPFVDGQAIALRLRYLAAIGIKEQLEDEALRRLCTENSGDLGRKRHRIDQVLARHLIVDAERDPAHRPIDLPLQLGRAAGDGHGHLVAIDRVEIGNGACVHIAVNHRHLQHHPGFRADRQERRIGRAAFRAQRRQHDAHHRVIVRQDLQQRRIEPARRVAIGRRHEFIVKAKPVKKGAQPGVVVRGKAFVGAKGVGNAGQALAEICAQHVAIGDIVRNLAQAVHVVGEGHQPRRRAAGHQAVGIADHRRARHLLKGADVRQARRPVTGLEQGRPSADAARDHLARLLERPGL